MYPIKTISTLKSLFNVNFFFIKYQNLNYLYLFNIIIFQGILYQNLINIYLIKIIKNNKNILLNSILNFRSKFKIFKYLFKNKFKFTRLLYILNYKKKIYLFQNISKSLNSFYFKNNINLNFYYKNTFQLIGGLVSPFSWDLNLLKNFKNLKNPSIIKNNNYIKFFNKKIYLFNFFYFNNLPKNNFQLKINSKNYNKQIKKPFQLRINLFFNLSNTSKKNYYYQNYFIIMLYKNYIKFFKFFKKFNFKNKIWTNIWFQKFSEKFTVLKKIKYKLNKNIFNSLFYNIASSSQNYFFKNNKTNPTIYNNSKNYLLLTNLLSFKIILIAKLFFIKIIHHLNFNNKNTFYWTLNFIKLNTKNFNLFFLLKNKLKLKKFFFYNIINKNNFINIIFNFKKNLNLKLINLKYIYFVTKYETSLILYNYSFLYLTVNQFNSNLTHTIKKNLYSFIYKNELEKLILKKYQKTNFISNLSINSIIKENLKIFNSIKKNLLNSLNSNKLNTLNWKSYFLSNLNLYDFSIRRIKFKPGYMNIWRSIRNTFKRLSNISFKYQHRLTNFLLKYKKYNKFKTFLINEMTLINILLKSRFILDLKTTDLFIKNGLIFINGIACYNSNFQLFIGDFIQIILNIKYYILYKWLYNWSLRTKIKIKNKMISKFYNSQGSEEKQRSFLFSKWILQNKTLISDVSKYTEIDHFTLSIFIIYEPFLWNDLNVYSIYYPRYNIINLYNWKYIT